MARLRYGAGIATIEMDDTMDQLIRRAIENVQPGVVAKIEAATKAVAEDCERRWPVKTGKSKAGFDWYVAVTQDGTRIRGVIQNPVPYTFYVRPSQLFGGTTGWAEWVQRPMKAAAAKLVDELGPQIVRDLSSRLT